MVLSDKHWYFNQSIGWWDIGASTSSTAVKPNETYKNPLVQSRTISAMLPLKLLLVPLLLYSAAGTGCDGAQGCEADVSNLVQWGRNRREQRREQRREHRRERRYYAPPPKKQKPNILLIIVDDLGFNQVGMIKMSLEFFPTFPSSMNSKKRLSCF